MHSILTGAPLRRSALFIAIAIALGIVAYLLTANRSYLWFSVRLFKYSLLIALIFLGKTKRSTRL